MVTYVDTTGLGIGPEIYLAVIMVMMVFMLLGIFLFSPFLPIAFATLGRKKIIGMIDRTRQVRLQRADIRNGMYYLDGKPWRFVKQYPGAFWIGKGIPFEFVHIDQAFVQDPYMNAAVEELKDQYGITNYLELQNAIDQGIIDKDDDLLVPLFFRVPMDSLLTYGAVVPPADITGEVEDLVEDRKTPEMATLKKLLPWALFFVMIVMGGALGYAIISGS